MNGKTVKLIRRYSLQTGVAEKNLKREWLSMNGNQRFERRQKMLESLLGKTKK